MYYITATAYFHGLTEQNKDILKTVGFTNPESQHIWNKLYEVNDVWTASYLLSGLLGELDLEPYEVTFRKNYAESLDFYEPVCYNALNI